MLAFFFSVSLMLLLQQYFLLQSPPIKSPFCFSLAYLHGTPVKQMWFLTYFVRKSLSEGSLQWIHSSFYCSFCPWHSLLRTISLDIFHSRFVIHEEKYLSLVTWIYFEQCALLLKLGELVSRDLAIQFSVCSDLNVSMLPFSTLWNMEGGLSLSLRNNIKDTWVFSSPL